MLDPLLVRPDLFVQISVAADAGALRQLADPFGRLVKALDLNPDRALFVAESLVDRRGD